MRDDEIIGHKVNFWWDMLPHYNCISKPVVNQITGKIDGIEMLGGNHVRFKILVDETNNPQINEFFSSYDVRGGCWVPWDKLGNLDGTILDFIKPLEIEQRISPKHSNYFQYLKGAWHERF